MTDKRPNRFPSASDGGSLWVAILIPFANRWLERCAIWKSHAARLFIVPLLLASAGISHAALTHIQGLKTFPDGTHPSGYYSIQIQAFTNAQGVRISAVNLKNIAIVNGVIDISLEPNIGASPSGVSYRIIYNLNGQAVTQMQWYVPVSSSIVPLDQIEFPVVGLQGPSAVIALSQLLQGGATLGQCLAWNGSNYAPSSSCSGGGGSSAFASLTSGTNTTAAMVVGSGASLTLSGTGTINANRIVGTTITALSGNSGVLLEASGTLTNGHLLSVDSNANAVDSGLTAATIVPITRTISTTAPLTGGGDLSADRTLSIPVATSSVNGYLVSADWTTFNNKQAALGYTPVTNARTVGTTSPLQGGGTLAADLSLTLLMWGSGARPVAASALGVPGNCVQWGTVGIADAGAACGTGSGGANALGTYLVVSSTNAPANAVNLGLLSTGLTKHTISAGVATISTAVSATDYAPATTGSSILKASSGGFANAVANTDYLPVASPTFTGTITGGAFTGTTGTFSGNLTTNVTGGGTQCVHVSNAGVISGTGVDCGSGTGFANTALSNLAAVSINTALLFQASSDIGSGANPTRNIYLYGSGTYGTNYFEFTGTPTGTRVLTLPNRTTNIASSSGSLTNGNCVSINASGDFVDAGGACTVGGGGGTVSSGTVNQIAYYTGTGTTVGGSADFTYTTHTFAGGASGLVDFSAIATTAGFKIPTAAGAVPTADGFIAKNSTTHATVWGANGTTIVGAAAATGTNTATTCSSQVVTAVSAIAIPTCSTITSAYVNNSIALTGTDINTSNQVTVTHLSSALPVNQGGTGTTSTLTGLMRGNASAMTAAELSGDVATSGSNVVTVSRINGVSFPTTGASFDALPILTSSNTVAYYQINGGSSCGDGTHAVSYNATTHLFGCQSIPAVTPGGSNGQIQYNSSGAFAGFTAGGDVTFAAPNFTVVATHLSSALPVAQGGTGLTSGTSGGVPYYSGSTSIASSAALTQNAIVLGGGAGLAPTVIGSLGSTTTVLHGNASGAPTFGSVSLTGDVSGVLPVASGGNGSVSGTQDQYLRIKPNTGNNTTYEFANLPVINPTDFTFTQTPGGSLSAGTQTITLTPCPNGVAGADTNHYLYVSGGTGTAEAALITQSGGAGTCTSGASSGTIKLTIANSHSGAWTVTSASAGIDEAFRSVSGPRLQMARGTYDIYGTIYPPVNATLKGAGVAATVLNWNQTNAKMFFVKNTNFAMSEIYLSQIGTATSGSIGIYTEGTGSGVSGSTADLFVFTDVWATGFFNGLYLNGVGHSHSLTRVTSVNALGDCIIAKGAQGYWETVILEGCVGNGATVQNSVLGGNGWSPFMTGIQTFDNGGWGVEFNGFYAQISGLPSFFNADYLGAIHITSGTALSTGGWVSDAWIQSAGDTHSRGVNTTARGILIDANMPRTVVQNINFTHVEGNCLEVNSSSNLISSINDIGGCGDGAVAGNRYSMKITGDNNTLSGNHANGPYYVSGTFNQILNNQVFLTSATLPALNIPAGSNVLIDQNVLYNAGAGGSITCVAGGTLIEGKNSFFGTVANACTLSTLSTTLTPTTNYTTTYVNLGGGAAGVQKYCTDCTAGSPCTSGGTGALAVSNGGGWVCR